MFNSMFYELSKVLVHHRVLRAVDEISMEGNQCPTQLPMHLHCETLSLPRSLFPFFLA